MGNKFSFGKREEVEEDSEAREVNKSGSDIISRLSNIFKWKGSGREGFNLVTNKRTWQFFKDYGKVNPLNEVGVGMKPPGGSLKTRNMASIYKSCENIVLLNIKSSRGMLMKCDRGVLIDTNADLNCDILIPKYTWHVCTVWLCNTLVTLQLLTLVTTRPLNQSEAITWSVSTSQPNRGQYPDHLISVNQSEASMRPLPHDTDPVSQCWHLWHA